MRFICLLLALLFLFPNSAMGEEKTEGPEASAAPKASVLTDRIHYSSDMPGYPRQVRDRDLDTSFSVSAEYPLHIDIRESQPAWLCIAWEYAAPKRSVRFLDKNNILLEEVNTLFPFHNEVLSVPQNTQYIELQGLEDAVVSISDLYLYGEGALPEPWCYDWQPTPEKLDFLVAATHFDDDAIWLGAVMPLLGAEEGYTGVILYMTYQQRLRLNEALMGAWTMGERGYPLFSMLPDVYLEKYLSAAQFSYDIVLQYMVRCYRQYKPLVVFTQDLEGEYGHWQHKQTARCALDAIPLAADSTYDRESAEKYGVWQVQKAYTHLYPENKIQLDTRRTLTAFDGKTAVEVANDAYKKHASQFSYHAYRVADDYKYSIADFGLSYSAIQDPGTHPFAGIGDSLLCRKSAKASEEKTVPTDTPAPKQTTAHTDALTTPADHTDTPMSTDAPATEDTSLPADGEEEEPVSRSMVITGCIILAVGLYFKCRDIQKKGPAGTNEEDAEDEELEEDLDAMEEEEND